MPDTIQCDTRDEWRDALRDLRKNRFLFRTNPRVSVDMKSCFTIEVTGRDTPPAAEPRVLR